MYGIGSDFTRMEEVIIKVNIQAITRPIFNKGYLTILQPLDNSPSSVRCCTVLLKDSGLT
ncbi:hypothetical protein E2C01_024707 [Portunus trituberculatus]|uniref:Uncharacterized protein n=1 Tax=Portunus trituberculatus TaxID=210409 RepID=A0A5B7ED36_PORTR|nr:hypothetical protein [Portunus trituberculatus]